MKINENIEIIKKAHTIIKNEYAFRRSTIYIQNSFLEGVKEENYKKIDNKLKAIRQDFAKIVVMMNVIDKAYSRYVNESTLSYDLDNEATEELGCFIEYLFAKYRVMLEYIYQIMEICILPKLNNVEQNEYKGIRKINEKYEYLLRYVAENIDEDNNILNMEWFQNIRKDRNFIIHDGATCLVFGDKENLVFKVMTTDALDKEEFQTDEFYSKENGIIDYERYWGLQIAKLIVFFETIMKFLIETCSVSSNENNQMDFTYLWERNKLVDENGTVHGDKQDVLENILEKLINM